MPDLPTSLDMATTAFLAGTAFVALIWTLLPFSLFGVRGRLESIEAAKRDQTEMLVAELRQMHAALAAPQRSR